MGRIVVMLLAATALMVTSTGAAPIARAQDPNLVVTGEVLRQDDVRTKKQVGKGKVKPIEDATIHLMWGADPQSGKANPSTDLQTVATATANEEGKYKLHLSPSPLMKEAASRNSGWVNFTLFVFTPDGTFRPTGVTRKLGDDGWEKPEVREYNNPDNAVTTTIGYKKSGASVNGQRLTGKEQSRLSNSKPLACREGNSEIYQQATAVVDFQNSFPADGKWTYGSTADSEIDMGVNLGATGWEVSGSVTIANQASGEVSQSYSDNFSTFGQTAFEYHKTQYLSSPDCPVSYTEVKAVDWSGGVGHQGSGTVATCHDEPFNNHVVEQPKGSGFSIDYSTATKISGAVKAADVVELGATSGYSQNVKMEWDMKRGAVEFCGRDDHPGGSNPGPGVIVNNPLESAVE